MKQGAIIAIVGAGLAAGVGLYLYSKRNTLPAPALQPGQPSIIDRKADVPPVPLDLTKFGYQGESVPLAQTIPPNQPKAEMIVSKTLSPIEAIKEFFEPVIQQAAIQQPVMHPVVAMENKPSFYQPIQQVEQIQPALSPISITTAPIIAAAPVVMEYKPPVQRYSEQAEEIQAFPVPKLTVTPVVQMAVATVAETQSQPAFTPLSRKQIFLQSEYLRDNQVEMSGLGIIY